MGTDWRGEAGKSMFTCFVTPKWSVVRRDVSLNKTQVISMACDGIFSKGGSMLMCGAAGLRRMMIMKTLMALSVLMLTVFASISGPAIAADIRSERGAPGWDGPQDPSPPWAPPG